MPRLPSDVAAGLAKRYQEDRMVSRLDVSSVSSERLRQCWCEHQPEEEGRWASIHSSPQRVECPGTHISAIPSAIPIPKKMWLTRLDSGAVMPSGECLPHTPNPMLGKMTRYAARVVAAP